MSAVSPLPLPIAILFAAAGLLMLVGVAAWIAEIRYRARGLKCIRCGCTDARACAAGCWWVTRVPPVCSNCFPD